MLLAGFAVTQSFQLRRTTRERDRANRITELMEGMFKVSDPSAARGNSITASDINGAGAGPRTPGSDDDLGWILNQQGPAAEAEKLQRETVATRRRVFGNS
jgi:hypothetical protein